MKTGYNTNSSALEKFTKPIIFGLIIGTVVIGALFVLFTLIISFDILPINSANVVSSIAISVGSFFAGFSSAKRLAKNGLIIGAICGFITFLLFTIIGIAAFKSAPSTSALIRLLIFTTSGAIGGIIGVGNAHKRKIV